MKIHPTARKFRSGVPSLGFLIGTMLLLAACSGSQKVSHSGSSSEQLLACTGNWYPVSDDPPVFFPVGVPADAKTDYRHGEFVFSGEGDAMWFVPDMGTEDHGPSELRQQAFSMRTFEQQRILADYQHREHILEHLATPRVYTYHSPLTGGSVEWGKGGSPGAAGPAYSRLLEEELYPVENVTRFAISRSEGEREGWTEEQKRKHAEFILAEDKRRVASFRREDALATFEALSRAGDSTEPKKVSPVVERVKRRHVKPRE